MKLTTLIATLLFTLSLAFSQPNISFSKKTHDFGRVANLSYPPTNFSFTNTGNEALAILMANKSKSVKVSYTKGFIQPGESGQLLVLPDLNTLGMFEETISLVTNASGDPAQITIRGEVVSIQACFPNADDWNIRKIVVTDIDTKTPIENVSINLTHNMSKQFSAKTGKDGTWTGEMPIGQYNFQLDANNYHSVNLDKYIARSVPVLFFEMDMIAPQAPRDEIEIIEPEPTLSEEVIEPASPIESSSLLPVGLYAANNIVLLLDVSYSMRANKKLELLKQSINNLAEVLREIDNVSLITYAGTPKTILESTNGSNTALIQANVNALSASGITNGVKGLESAYSIASSNLIATGNNQIILATDGMFTGGTQQPEAFKEMISDYAAQGIILSIIGFGVDEDAKNFMMDMSLQGQGSYIHVSTEDDISETLIEEIKDKSIRR